MAEVRSIISTNWPRILRRARTRNSVQIASRPLSRQISRPLPPAIPVCGACRQTRRATSGALPPELLTTLIRTRGRPSSTEGSGRPRNLFPLVAAVAERFRRTSIDTNAASATIESHFDDWSYTTEIILSNQALRFVVRNRMKVVFGTGLVTPFDAMIKLSPRTR